MRAAALLPRVLQHYPAIQMHLIRYVGDFDVDCVGRIPMLSPCKVQPAKLESKQFPADLSDDGFRSPSITNHVKQDNSRPLAGNDALAEEYVDVWLQCHAELTP